MQIIMQIFGMAYLLVYRDCVVPVSLDIHTITAPIQCQSVVSKQKKVSDVVINSYIIINAFQ